MLNSGLHLVQALKETELWKKNLQTTNVQGGLGPGIQVDKYRGWNYSYHVWLNRLRTL